MRDLFEGGKKSRKYGIYFQLLISSFFSSTPVSSLKWLHNGVVVASRSTCSGTPFIYDLWSVDSDDEGVYTCRMELSNGTTVERSVSEALNVVGMYACIYHVAMGTQEGVYLTSSLTYSIHAAM